MNEFCQKVYRVMKNIPHWLHRNERDEIHEVINRVEDHYKNVKTDLEDIQRRIDPLKELLLEMGETFGKKNRSGEVNERE